MSAITTTDRGEKVPLQQPGSSKIEDAGQKLRGARKHAAQKRLKERGQDPAAQRQPSGARHLLDQLWPKPAQWRDLITQIGGQRAALCMVMREGLAKNPHTEGHLQIPADQWREAFEICINVLRGILETPGDIDLKAMCDSYDIQVGILASHLASPIRIKNQWSYAIGSSGGRTTKHPFRTSPINDLRWRYLHEWGWGQDPRVSDRLSMGALKLIRKATGQRYWQAVKGQSGMWVALERTEFATEREAIECARTHVNRLLDAQTPSEPTGPGHTRWQRPHAANLHLRTGFDRPSATDKTELDLLNTFGFRGIEFGNWVTQAGRRDFVNATYDALMDLTQLLGMPPSFASLGGMLGIAYGSRGKGLSTIAAHFEIGNWVLHLTKDNGPGALAHEFGHAIDAWVAHSLWGSTRARLLREEAAQNARSGKARPPRTVFEGKRSLLAPELASEQDYWSANGPAIEHSLIAKAFAQWADQIDPWNNSVDHIAQKHYGRPAWSWIQTSKAMDAARKPYWSSKPEIFARAFEILIHDSLKHKNRTSPMLVNGVGEEDGAQVLQADGQFPYPLGEERPAVCRQVAIVVRAIKTEYLHRMGIAAKPPQTAAPAPAMT